MPTGGRKDSEGAAPLPVGATPPAEWPCHPAKRTPRQLAAAAMHLGDMAARSSGGTGGGLGPAAAAGGGAQVDAGQAHKLSWVQEIDLGMYLEVQGSPGAGGGGGGGMRRQ